MRIGSKVRVTNASNKSLIGIEGHIVMQNLNTQFTSKGLRKLVIVFSIRVNLTTLNIELG